ncbi:RHS repeat-associated core domain-containing protein [Nocardioides maradonensis]
MYAVSSGPGGYGATPVSVAGNWQVGTGSGEFSYGYGLKLPPANGGATPDVSLAYSSGAVDGMTSAANGQASQMGLGWELDPGSITRPYYSCDDDGRAGKFDLCWHTENGNLVEDLTLSLNGRNERMVALPSAPNQFRLINDPGWKISRFRGDPTNGPSNGDNDDEGFEVITPDGTQYWFGWGHVGTDAVLTVPVFGDNAGEPCYSATTSAAWCQQGWKWMLDRVVDPSGNKTTYFYTTDNNYYARWGTTNTTYDMSAELTSVAYGYDQATDTAQETLSVTRSRRCTRNTDTDANTDCSGAYAPGGASATASIYPDVPLDLVCAQTQQCQAAPSFFSLWMYNTATSKVGTTIADTWSFNHGFPDPDTTTSPSVRDLWLKSISHTGYNSGGSLASPDVTFTGVSLQNRVNPGQTNKYFKFRIASVTNETGGRTDVTYGHANDKACTSNYVDNVDPTIPPLKVWQSEEECFQTQWLNDDTSGTKQLKWTWFHKYVVTKLVLSDTALGYGASGSTTVLGKPQTYTYEYLGKPGWRFSASPSKPASDETWSDWRGYPVTIVRRLDTDGTVLSQERVARFRGLDGTLANDKTPPDHRTERVSTLEMGDTGASTSSNDQLDKPWLNGQVAEDAFLVPDGQPSAGAVISRTYNAWKPDAVYTIDNRGPNGEDIRSARLPIPDSTKQVTGLFNADGTVKTTSRSRTVSYTYDQTAGLSINTGRLLSALDTGDPNNPNDDTCTQYQSATNNTAFIRGPSRTRTWAWSQLCAPGGTDPDSSKLLRQQQVYYDGQASAISKGLPTTVDVSTGASGDQGLIRTTASYDAYGRVTSQTAPAYVKSGDGITTGRGVVSTTTYNSGGNAGAPITSIKATEADINPAGDDLVTTAVYDKLRGQPTQVTDPNGGNTLLTYDPLGELTQVREPGQAAADPANLTFDYTLFGGSGQPARVRARTLRDDTGPSPVYDDSYSYYDGWGHVVETQTPQPDSTSKRIVAFTGYDARGLASIAAPAVPNDNAPGTGLLNADPSQVVRYATTTYDALGRPTKVTNKSNGTTVSSTSTTYLGDAVIAQPATGGVTVTRLDGQGNTSQVELHSTHAPGSIGQSGDATLDQSSYGYDPVGDLTSMTKAVATTGGANNGSSATYTWAYGYDLTGRRIWAYDPDTGTTTTQYDAAGQPTTVTTGPTGPQSSTIDLTAPYNPTIPNPASVITTQYDAIERPTQRLDYTDVHSDSDQPVTLASWGYDDHTVANSLGRQTSVTVPISNIANVLGGHGGTHVTKVKAYDNRGNVTDATETIPNWTFNPLANNPDDTTTWEWTTSYNQAGQSLTQNYPAVPGLAPQTVKTSYTTGGRVASITTGDGTTTGAHVHLADETYNNIGQTNTLDTGRFAGDPTGRSNQTDGIQRTYTWQPTTGRLDTTTAAIATPDANNLTTTYDALKLGYTYDDTGNPTLVTNTTKAGPGQTVTPIVKQFCYAYDPAQRLQRAATGAPGDDQCADAQSAPTNPGDALLDPDYDLSYGFTGDRLTSVTDNLHKVDNSNDPLTVSYENGNAGTSSAPGQPHQTTATTANTDVGANLNWPRELPNLGDVSYDANGRINRWGLNRLTSAVGDNGSTAFDYTYDHEGHLTKTTPSVGAYKTVTNSYNADGTRFISQNSLVDVVKGQTVYLADGTEINTDLLGVSSTRRFATPAGTPLAYVRGGDPTNPIWNVLFADGQNSLRLTAVHDPNGTNSAVTPVNYYPYGDRTQDAPLKAPGDHGYLNKVEDVTGDIRLDQREYTPDLNQLTTPDPILTPGDPLSANPYSYSGNNPIATSDPSGLMRPPPPDDIPYCDAECQAVPVPVPIPVNDDGAGDLTRSLVSGIGDLASGLVHTAKATAFSFAALGMPRTVNGESYATYRTVEEETQGANDLAAGLAKVGPILALAILTRGRGLGEAPEVSEASLGSRLIAKVRSLGLRSRGTAPAAEGAPLSGRIVTEEGLGDTAIRNSLRVKSEDGFFDVVGHGTPSDVSGMSPGELADAIRARPGWGGQDVRLLSCSTGCPSGTFAQDLANDLGVVVRAPTTDIYVSSRGGITFDPGGSWRTFTPGG